MENDSESVYRQQLKDWQIANNAAGGAPYGEFAKSAGLNIDRAYDVYLEESDNFRASAGGQKMLSKSSDKMIILGLALFFIPPLSIYFLWVGMADLAESKGYDRSLAALSLLHVIGLIILTAMPKRTISN